MIARLPVALTLSVLAGVLLWLGFPPVATGLAPVLGVAALTTALWGASGRRGLGLGAVAGAAFFLPLLEWMRVIGPDAWLLLAALCTLWVALTGWGTALVTRLPAAPVWVACVWVLGEALRARIPLGGFPWGNLSYAQADTWLGTWAAAVGAPGATFAVALAGASVVALGRALLRRGLTAAIAWSAVLVAIAVGPLLVSVPSTGDTTGGGTTATVALVQGGTPQMGMGAMDVRREVLDRHVAQTMDLAAAIKAGREQRPDFVLWPENASDIDPYADPAAAEAITAAARAVGAPILVGAVVQAEGDAEGVWNTGIVWDPAAGPTAMYVKTHPVPFGEYVPFRSLIADLVGRFDRVPRDFLAGERPGLLDVGGVDVGDVICFEIAYQEVVDAVVDGGARLITVQTNNATYGGTSQPSQQLQISRIRATEFGRTVLVAATSGITAAIGTDRTVVQSLDVGETGWLVATVPLHGDLTLASRIGHVVELLMCLVAVVAVGIAVVRSRRARRESPRVDE